MLIVDSCVPNTELGKLMFGGGVLTIGVGVLSSDSGVINILRCTLVC